MHDAVCSVRPKGIKIIGQVVTAPTHGPRSRCTLLGIANRRESAGRAAAPAKVKFAKKPLPKKTRAHSDRLSGCRAGGWIGRVATSTVAVTHAPRYAPRA